MQIHPSVLAEGHPPDVIYRAIETALITTHIGNGPTQLLVLGEDAHGDVLEITSVVRPEDILVVFARSTRDDYRPLIDEARHLFSVWADATPEPDGASLGRSTDGLALTDAFIAALFDDAEKGYDVDRLATRTRPGRPAPLTVGGVLLVGLDAELAALTAAHVVRTGDDPADVLTQALEAYLG